jgi:hypothetical protein
MPFTLNVPTFTGKGEKFQQQVSSLFKQVQAELYARGSGVTLKRALLIGGGIKLRQGSITIFNQVEAAMNAYGASPAVTLNAKTLLKDGKNFKVQLKAMFAATVVALANVPTPAVSLDFGANTFTGGIASQITFTRASTKTDLLSSSPSGYAYRTFAVNERAWTQDRGDLNEIDATNFVVNPTTPATQTINLAAVGVYVLWVNGPGSATLAANTAVLSAPSKLLSGPGTARQGSVVKIKVLTAGTVDITVAGTLYAMQLELAPAAPWGPTSFMPTGSRSADRYPIVNASAAYNALASATCTVIAEYESTDGTQNFGTIINIGSQGLAYYFSPNSFFSNRDNGTAALTNTLGEGTSRKAKVAVAWSSGGRSTCGNGGVVNTDANSLKIINFNSYTIGHTGSTTTFNLNGFIKRIDIFTTRLTDAQLRAMTRKTDLKFARIWMGDSLTARADGQVPANDRSITAALDTELGYGVTINGGVEGNISTQVATRYLASPEFWNLPLIIRVGNNNIASTSTILADIASMIAVNTSGKFLILPPLNGQAANFQSGGSLYVNLTSLWTSLVAAYPNNTYDDRADLVAAYDPANPVDVLNHTEDRVPASLRLISNVFNITAAIDNSQTNFVLGANPGADAVLWFPNGGEYIRVTTSTGTSGGTVTACVRAYGTGGAATTHSIGDVCYVIDNVHLNDIGRGLSAKKVKAKLNTMGWAA